MEIRTILLARSNSEALVLENPMNINYTITFLCYYIYKRKLQNDSVLLRDFINKIDYKYKLEKLIQ